MNVVEKLPMQLTIEQALQQAISAHKQGNLKEAENIYRAILRTQPTHPDANYNLGTIAVSFNQIEAALPLFKTALDVNPNHQKFWLSYVDALVRAERLKDAKQVIKKAKKRGVDVKKLNKVLSNSKPKRSGDAEVHYNLGNTLYRLGKLDDAEASYKKALVLKPNYAEAYNNLGATLLTLGRMQEALASCSEAIALKPGYAAAHNNLGITLKELGRFDESVASCKQAIILKPDFTEAHSNLGNALKELGRLGEAVSSFKQAIALKPEYADAHINLGITFKELGRLDDALDSYIQALAFKPESAEAYVNLAIALKNASFKAANPRLYSPIIQLLHAGNFARPSELVRGILSLMKHDAQTKELLCEHKPPFGLRDATLIIDCLNEIPLLHHLMRLCPLPDLQFEELFVAMRSSLLKTLYQHETSSELIFFQSTLSIHCFVNEYIYIETEEEAHLVGELQSAISQTLAKSEQPSVKEILCLASYRPLYQYDWCQKLESLDDLPEVKRRLVEEPHLEKMIAREIPVLAKISDDVSRQVRAQYEENPYPRWVHLGVFIKAKSIASVIDELGLSLPSKNIENVSVPSILVAGCGSGQQSIETASRFSNCHVTAVDLSLASLAYAQRKTNELGLGNVEYLQADILHLEHLGEEFDIIESTGVLHHMDEPLAGWTLLVGLLRPGGLMKIGLYSELARRHIVEIRKEISALKLGGSEADIRKFRQSLIESEDDDHQLLTNWNDFYSLSTLRDLIFHVKEHRFTLPKIKKILDELGLEFCGFENRDAIAGFRNLYGEGADIYDLSLWHKFEELHPSTFAQMYQFWCQKPQA